jgi:hypothetical protein
VEFWFVCSFGVKKKKHEKKWENTKEKKGRKKKGRGHEKHLM